MGEWDRRSWESPGAERGTETDGPDAEEQLAQTRVNVARQRRSVQRKADREAAGGVALPAAGGGAALDGNVRRKMEGHLGGDLSGVRVHTGGESAQAASALGARAFTDGRDVHFNAGQFAPGSKEGDRLLAHELTHVVQGQKSGIQRKDDEKKDAGDGEGAEAKGEAGAEAGQLEVSKPGDPAEEEADKLGDEVADKEHGADAKGEKKDEEKKKKGGKKDGKEEDEDEKAEGKDGEQAGGDSEKKAGEQKGNDKKAEEKPAAVSAKYFGLAAKLFRSTQTTTQQNTTQPAGQQAGGQQNAGGHQAPGAGGQVPVSEGGPEGGANPQFEKIDKGKVKDINGGADLDGTSEKQLIELEGKWWLFKPSKGDGQVPRAQAMDIQQGQYGRRAAAGAAVAGAVGLDTPGVRLVEIGGVRGSLQEFENGKKTLKDFMIDDPAAYAKIVASPQYQKLRSDIMALDYLINNLDRNPGNFFVELGPAGADDVIKLTPIDHDLCFTKDPNRPPVIAGWIDGFPEKYTRTMWDNLKKLKASEAQFTSVLEKFLMKQEIAGVFKRLDDMLADINKKIAAKGEAGTFHQ